MKLLIIEDDQSVAELERDYLEINGGFDCTLCTDGTEGLRRALAEDYALVIVDVMLPGLSGFEICRRLREEKDTPVIIISALADDIDKVRGLGLGADDYMTKPFSPSELVARVDAVYRRVALAGKNGGKDAGEEIQSGEFVLNLRNRYLTRRGVQIELTQVEFQIIEYFFTHPGTALSRTDILHHVWGGAYVGEEKIVDVNIRRLRMKVEDQPSAPRHIVTVWGYGYRWEG